MSVLDYVLTAWVIGAFAFGFFAIRYLGAPASHFLWFLLWPAILLLVLVKHSCPKGFQ